jgi:hypothetical protein
MFSLNSNKITVAVKESVPLQINEKDSFNLHWNDNEKPSRKTFELDLTQQRFTPSDILVQLTTNQIDLKGTWLILDEFVYFLNKYLLILFVFSVKNSQIDFLVDVIVLFSSPSTNRWREGKEGSVTIGFGMEVPDEDEYLKIKKLMYNHLPNYLCNPIDYRYSEIDSYLRSLGLLDGPEKYERKDLFGLQPRYLFGSNDDIINGLNGLRNALKEYSTSRVLIQTNENNIQPVKSHKLTQLNFSSKNRIFYHLFVSEIICFLSFEEIKNLEKTELEIQLERYKNQNTIIYGDLYEKYMVSRLMAGTPITFRILRDFVDYGDRFRECPVKFFCCVNHPPIQMWYEDINHTCMLGTTPIDKDTLYYPTDRNCYTIDAVLLEKRKDEQVNKVINVNFIQVTTRNDHGVSPGGFFAMFMLVKLIKSSNECDASVYFYFIVPEELYPTFNSSEADYLYNLFDGISVRVLKFNEGKNFSKDYNSINSQSSCATKQQKTRSRKEQNKVPNETSSSLDVTVMEEKETLSRKKRNTTNEMSNETSSSSVYIFTPLLLTPSRFNNVCLKLIWNNNIECVFDDLRVTVNNSLDGEDDKKKLDLFEDPNYFENFNLPRRVVPVKENKIIKSNKITSNFCLVPEDTYLQNFTPFSWKYFKICTL